MSITNLRPPNEKVAPSASTPKRLRSRWIDLVVSSDPGFTRLRHAIQSVLTITMALAAEWVFVHFTGALQAGAGATAATAKASEVAMVNHDLLAVAMVLGAIVGLISSLGVNDPTAKGQVITLLILPAPIISALAFGIGIGGHRTLALVVIALVLASGTYLRRFGPRGFVAGQLLFIGFFLGFSLHSSVAIGDVGWLAAEVGVALAVAFAVRFGLFYPHRIKAMERTQRSFDTQARHVATLALGLFDTSPSNARCVKRMHRRLLRLNEAALMIDAQLGDPLAVPEGSSGELLHQRLFDVELALTNITRFAESMAHQGLPDNQRSEVRLALLDIARGDKEGAKAHAVNLAALLPPPGLTSEGDAPTIVVAHRFSSSVIALAEGMTEWMAAGKAGDDQGTFSSSVVLLGGWLPGSAQVSSAASLESPNQWGEGIHLAHYARTAVQMGIAAGAAIALGDLLSPQRFYWAVIAAFITFMGAHNAGEQIRKALLRVGGTVIGIGLGSLLVSAVGHHTYWSIAVILVSLFLGLYLFRISYAFLAVAITVTVSQLYQQLGEFTNSLLLVRLEETALGAAVAIIVVIAVLPLHTRPVLRVAMREHIEAVGRLVDHASGRLVGRDVGFDTTLRSDARAVDAAYQAVIATAQPLRRSLSGGADEDIARVLHLTSASRNYSRNLVVDVDNSGMADVDSRLDIAQANATLHTSIEIVAQAASGSRDGTYTRSSALFDRAERRMESGPHRIESTAFVLRDLRLLDGTMACLAELMGLRITDHDTVAIRG